MLNALEKIQSILETPLLRLGRSAVSLSAIAQLLLIALAVLAVAFGLKRFLSLHVLKRLGLQQGTRESVAVITSYALATPLGIVLLQAAGINLASLTVIAGSLGVGIGFGLQEITKNFVSGIALLLERKLKVGDFVEAGEISGYIDEISLRSTVIRTVTQKHVIVPNSDLISNRVTNWTYSNFKGWVILPISVTHESDPILVIEVLMDSAYLEETVSLEYPPEVLFLTLERTRWTSSCWYGSTRLIGNLKLRVRCISSFYKTSKSTVSGWLLLGLTFGSAILMWLFLRALKTIHNMLACSDRKKLI